MSLAQIDLNLFLVFDAIYQQRNLTRAADVLCLSQPAVSNALARLRQSLGDPLFIRSAKGMTPTPMAENIIGRVQEALQLLDSGVTEGTVFDPSTSNKIFRLSMSDLSEAIVLPKLMEVFKSQAPNAGIECYFTPRDNLEQELIKGAIDLALDVPVLLSSQISIQPLLKERYVCVVRHDHPLIGNTISLDQYLALDHIQVSSRRKGQGFEDVALHRLGRQRSVRVRVPHHQVAPFLVRDSDMVLTLPMSMAINSGLKILELPFSMAPVDWNLYWHKSADNDQTNGWIRKIVASLLS
jgi:DNA-binding transcriptional LysR family regulator